MEACSSGAPPTRTSRRPEKSRNDSTRRSGDAGDAPAGIKHQCVVPGFHQGAGAEPRHHRRWIPGAQECHPETRCRCPLAVRLHVHHRSSLRTISCAFPLRLARVTNHVTITVCTILGEGISDGLPHQSTRHHVLTGLFPSSIVCWRSPGHRRLLAGDSTQIMPQCTFIENGTDSGNFGESTIPLRGRPEGRTCMF